MWDAVVGWVKALFGAKRSSQFGSGNQAVSGSTAGANSPVVTAGGNVHFNMLAPPAAEGPSACEEAEQLVPGLMAELRKDLAANPLVRDVIILETKTTSYNWPGPHLVFSEDERLGVYQEAAILVNHGLLVETRSRFSYRITEELARHLCAA